MIIRWGLALVAMALVWLGLLAGLTRFTDAPPAVFVPLVDGELIKALPRDVSIVDSRATGLTLQSDTPGLAKRLYELGAPIVLPAGLPQCVEFTRDAPAPG